MSRKGSDFDAGALFGFLIGMPIWFMPFLFIGACIGEQEEERHVIKAAIKANYAHYHPKTGEVVWDKCKELKP